MRRETTSRRAVRRAARLTDGLLTGSLPVVDAGDTWSTDLLPDDSRDVDDWHRAAFRSTPGWVAALLRLRNALVRPLGLRAPTDARAGFPELARSADEVLLGLDDRHLSFRVAVRVTACQVHVVTLVQRHNALGRAYWAVVRWFHPLVIRAVLRHVPVPLAAVTTGSGGGEDENRTARTALVGEEGDEGPVGGEGGDGGLARP